MKFDRVAASFGGTLVNAQIGSLHAAGPWGSSTATARFRRRRSSPPGSIAARFEGLAAVPRQRDSRARSDFGACGGRGRRQSHHRAEHESRYARRDAARRPGFQRQPHDRRRRRPAARLLGPRARSRRRCRRGRDVFAREPSGDRRPACLAGGQAAACGTAAWHRLPLDAGRLWASGNLGSRCAVTRRSTAASSIAHGRVQHYALAGGGDVKLAVKPPASRAWSAPWGKLCPRRRNDRYRWPGALRLRFERRRTGRALAPALRRWRSGVYDRWIVQRALAVGGSGGSPTSRAA